MHNPEGPNPIDITPDDDNLSPEAAEILRSESQPRGQKTMEVIEKDFSNLSDEEIDRRIRELEDINENAEIIPSSPERLSKRIINSKALKAAIGTTAGATLLAIIAAGAVSLGGFGKNAEKNNFTTSPANPAVEYNIDQGEGATDTGETHEAIGIQDGYDKDGMWTDEGKPNTVAFSNFQKVVDMFNGNVKEALKYVATNETEAMSDYVSALADKLRPAGFEGLNMAETNDKIENQLSNEEYDEVLQDFKDTIDKAEIEESTVSGTFANAYEAVKDGDAMYGSKEALAKSATIDHETMQLIQTQTNEKNTKVYTFTWRDDDGKPICKIVIKGGCAQVLEEKGSHRLKGLPEAVEQSLTGGGPITIITGGGPTTPDKPDKPDKP
ncbi:MAG: hypothetical protein Q4F58_01350, partial [Candidatus Saccharibacteria bacterium]|nr:hypothetical protein [Candidatus Saccharibacteria bacterium]